MENEKKSTFKHLLSPQKIGPIELRNSISVAPMNETMSGHNGEATEQMIAYFAARAKGGFGLVSTGQSWARDWLLNSSGGGIFIASILGICRA